MKLLLDENLSRRIVPFLQADFPWLKIPNRIKTAVLNILLEHRAEIEQALLQENRACVEIIEHSIIHYTVRPEPFDISQDKLRVAKSKGRPRMLRPFDRAQDRLRWLCQTNGVVVMYFENINSQRNR